MKEILFELNDGQIVGLSLAGIVAAWLALSLLGAILWFLWLGLEGEEVQQETAIGILITTTFLSAVLLAAIIWWKVTLVVLALALLFLGLPYAAYLLGGRIRYGQW